MKIFMVRTFKHFSFWLAVALVALVAQRASGYSLLGPFEEYQVAEIGYGGGDLGGPHKLGEEYRRVTPVLYYTFDETFWNFFGSNGVAAVEEAMAVYNSLTNVSSYSADLSEFPLESVSFNYKAQALNLTDLKSFVMSTLAEQLGLAEPERFTWTLHDREVGPGGCPLNVSYLVVKRNFDPITSTLDQPQTSSYVNGTYYSYQIVEICSGPNPLADAVEFPVDPLANQFTAVASFNAAYALGAFYNGLTRDDVAGLRYMLRTNNINVENTGADTITFLTNNAPQFLFTSNLFEFISAALTNDAATLGALYPNLLISSTTPVFTNVVSTNVIYYFTNSPFDPYGSPARLVSVVTRETNAVIYYNHTFVNAYITPSYPVGSNFQVPTVPGHSSSTGVVTVLTTNISTTACGPFSPYGSICTNVSLIPTLTNAYFGDFYILPTNFCGVSIISTQLVKALSITNATVVATNASGTTTNVNNEFFSQTPIYSFNQYVYVINPITCPEDYNERRQGIERIRFVRYDGGYDTLTGFYNFPITNQYNLTAMPLTNPAPVSQTIRRRVLFPDILFTASDLATESILVTGFGVSAMLRNLPFVSTNQLPSSAGPGTIAPSTLVTFNDVGPIFLNFTPVNMDELTQVNLFAWGSFDGSTNEPVVYPNGTSIENYELSKFVNVTPVYLPEGFLTSDAAHTNYYNVQLQVQSFAPNFTPPVTWQIAPYPISPGSFPPGLTISSTGPTTAVISGTPTQAATFDFVVRLTDSQGRTLDHSYFIQVNP
jgi:hypothetical protein